jgi:hypothetical protein
MLANTGSSAVVSALSTAMSKIAALEGLTGSSTLVMNVNGLSANIGSSALVTAVSNLSSTLSQLQVKFALDDQSYQQQLGDVRMANLNTQSSISSLQSNVAAQADLLRSLSATMVAIQDLTGSTAIVQTLTSLRDNIGTSSLISKITELSSMSDQLSFNVATLQDRILNVEMLSGTSALVLSVVRMNTSLVTVTTSTSLLQMRCSNVELLTGTLNSTVNVLLASVYNLQSRLLNVENLSGTSTLVGNLSAALSLTGSSALISSIIQLSKNLAGVSSAQIVSLQTSLTSMNSTIAQLALWKQHVSGLNASVNAINVQTFTSSGTYIPTPGMIYCIIEVVGAGGGGGSSQGASNVAAAGGGGGAGGYSKGLFRAASIGPSKTVAIGGPGLGGGVGFMGYSGGITSVGSLISASGGFGGSSASAQPYGSFLGGFGGTGSGGFVCVTGNASIFGGMPLQSASRGASSSGTPGMSYGAGGGGASTLNALSAMGGDGASGIVLITEFIAASPI